MTAQDRMTRARAALILDHPFFGALSLRLRLVPDNGIETARTDGKALRYNPQFVDGLSDPVLRGVIAHEVLHCAAGHCWRRGDRDARKWNMAADYAINPYVADAGLPLPEGALSADLYRGKSAEDIYAALQDSGGADGQQQGNGAGQGGQDRTGQGADNGQSSSDSQSGNDPGGCGAVDDCPPDDGKTDAEATEEQWRISTVQAAQAAKMMGSLPGIGARLLAEYTRPVLDWRTLLADFVTRTARNDYDWQRPSARYLSRGIILPGLRSNELPDVVVVVDTSGSIDDQTLSAFAGAISDVLAAYPTTAHVLAVDADVQSVAAYRSEDLPIRVDCKGGGGTDFRPAFRWVSENGVDPAALIYLTDLCGMFPDSEPGYPVLWVSTDPTGAAPFGDVVPIG